MKKKHLFTLHACIRDILGSTEENKWRLKVYTKINYELSDGWFRNMHLYISEVIIFWCLFSLPIRMSCYKNVVR